MSKNMIGIKEETEMTTEKEDKTVTEKPQRRRAGRPLGVARSKLSVPKQIEGYNLRWVNDVAGRIAVAEEGDYSFVKPQEVGLAGDRESKVKRLVGTQENGEPLFAYLMKIPTEFFLEDQETKQGTLDAIDDSIRRGQVERSSKDGRYVPNGGISYKT